MSWSRALTTAVVAAVVILIGCDATLEQDVAAGGEGPAGGSGGTPLSCVPPEVALDGECVLSGVPPEACGSGFSPDGRGGCVPQLVDGCPDAQVALLGETMCHPLVHCGDEQWSNIPVEPGTEYVDPNYLGNDSDGTALRPWTDAQTAVSAALDGDIIALAAGAYGDPPALLSKRLRIWGRCPEMVSFHAVSSGDALFINTEGSEVHQIALTGATTALIVSNALDVLVDRVWVHDTNDIAILVSSIGEPTSAVLQDVLVERAETIAIAVLSSDVTIDNTVVRDTEGNGFGPGRGIDVELDPVSGITPNAVVTRTIVRRAREAAFACLGGNCSLSEVALIDTRPQEDGRFGIGLAVQYSYGASSATLSQSYIGGAHMFGISAINSSAEVVESTIDGVAQQELGDDFGDGIAFLDPGELPLSLTVTRSRIANAARAGIASFGGAVQLDSVALECNTIDLDGEQLQGRSHDFDNLGANACWCGAGADPPPCKVLQSQLKPPPSP